MFAQRLPTQHCFADAPIIGPVLNDLVRAAGRLPRPQSTGSQSRFERACPHLCHLQLNRSGPNRLGVREEEQHARALEKYPKLITVLRR